MDADRQSDMRWVHWQRRTYTAQANSIMLVSNVASWFVLCECHVSAGHNILKQKCSYMSMGWTLTE